jgi:hypothetical protein
MQKITLAVLLLVILATPCSAQEIEPDGIFSIEGTEWNVCRMGIQLIEGTWNPYPLECYILRFDNGNIEQCYDDKHCRINFEWTYIDSPVLSIAYTSNSFGMTPIADNSPVYVMQPTAGMGVTIRLGECGGGSTCYFLIGIMFKVNDNWAPPGIE